MKKLALSFAIILMPFCALAQHKSGEYVMDKIMSADWEGVQPGLAILRGSLAGHDALADELGRIIVEGTSRQAFLAGEILRLSANSAGERGEPYLRARYVLRGAYEELWGTDNLRARSVITDLVLAGDENYVRDRFEASQKPAKACRNNPESRCPYNASEWCAIGRELVYFALRFPQALSEPAPSPEEVLPYCFGSIKEDGVWLHVVY